MHNEREYVVETIRSFLDGSSEKWEWSSFTSSSLRSAKLDELRLRAAAVALPLDSEGDAALRQLLQEAEELDAHGLEKRKAWRMEVGLAGGISLGALLWWISYVPGGGFFQNPELLIFPAAIGVLIVILRNRREEVGYYDPENREQNKQGRV